ncbi:MAG: helix-turn-helix transcriptional regulator, partial [Phreatobacter sp.]|uniref:helix-turn-helix transcriptional regulator n=1 Tax=Phreatobacter sp. TaxID=1966341 RepID=UPI00273657B4
MRLRRRFIKVTPLRNLRLFKGVDEVPVSAGDDVVRFGQLVRERRVARGWKQENLAEAAFSNRDRKGYVSQIENGKVPNITRDTVRNVARVLEIAAEQIPPALRWPEAAAVVQDTNTVVHEIKKQQDELVAALRDQAREFGIKEGMLIALARRYAEGTPGDFAAALAGLERALEVARDERERGGLPSNISSAVDAVVARIDALNDCGDLNGGQVALDEELAKLDAEDERRKAARARLYDKGIAQAILTRDAGNARRFLVARFELDAVTDTEKRYQAFRGLFIEWYQRGSEKGLNFELEVAIALAREAVSRADNLDHRGAMRTSLGVALDTLGERESGTARLEEA